MIIVMLIKLCLKYKDKISFFSKKAKNFILLTFSSADCIYTYIHDSRLSIFFQKNNLHMGIYSFSGLFFQNICIMYG